MREGDLSQAILKHKLPSGTVLFDRFEVQKRLGEGGSAAVYQCRAPFARHPIVAVKLFPATIAEESTAAVRLSREMRTAFKVDHPNVTRYIDIARTDELIGLIVEFVEGTTLESIINEGSLPIDQVLSIGCQAADAIEAVHAAGIIHRDIKPANILYSNDNVVKLTDFGLAMNIGEAEVRTAYLSGEMSRDDIMATNLRMTSTESLVGTPAYVSPEYILDGSIDQRSDLYALGILLFELTTGRSPHEGENLFELFEKKVLFDAPDVRTFCPNCPPALAEIIGRLLVRAPEHRLESAKEASQLIRSVQGHWRGYNTQSLSALYKQNDQEEETPLFSEKEQRAAWLIFGSLVLIFLSFLGLWLFQQL